MKIPNSFIFLYKRLLPQSFDCTENDLYSQTLLINPRCFVLSLKNRDLLFYADSNDISESDIKSVRNKSQIYINKFNKKVSDNFINDYIRCTKINKCKSCHKKDCFGIFRLDEKNFFSLSEEKIVFLIEKYISGKVLDIGCGDTLYKDILLRKNVCYLGVDILPIESTLPIIVGNFEEVDFADQYDSILLFRSLNHFNDTRFLLEKIYNLLKKNGKIFIIENELFGELKFPTNHFSSNPKHDYDHFHNYSLEEIEVIIKRCGGFNIIEKEPISSDTGNQWFILLEKIS